MIFNWCWCRTTISEFSLSFLFTELSQNKWFYIIHVVIFYYSRTQRHLIIQFYAFPFYHLQSPDLMFWCGYHTRLVNLLQSPLIQRFSADFCICVASDEMPAFTVWALGCITGGAEGQSGVRPGWVHAEFDLCDPSDCPSSMWPFPPADWISLYNAFKW